MKQRLSPANAVKYQELRTQNFKDFAAGLFDIVQQHGLIAGFAPPPIPEEIAYVPSPADTSTERFLEWDLEDWAKAGPFGQVITEWPMRDKIGAGGTAPGEDFAVNPSGNT